MGLALGVVRQDKINANLVVVQMLAGQLTCTSHRLGILMAERRRAEVASAGILTIAAGDAAARAAVVRRRHAAHWRERLQAVEWNAVGQEEFSETLVLVDDSVAIGYARSVEFLEAEHFMFESLDVHFLTFSVCSATN